VSDAADRIIALAHKQSEHPLRNAILFMTGWIILVAIGVVLIVIDMLFLEKKRAV